MGPFAHLKQSVNLTKWFLSESSKQALSEGSDHQVGTVRCQILSNQYEVRFQGFSLDQDRKQLPNREGAGSMPPKTSAEEAVT